MAETILGISIAMAMFTALSSVAYKIEDAPFESPTIELNVAKVEIPFIIISLAYDIAALAYAPIALEDELTELATLATELAPYPQHPPHADARTSDASPSTFYAVSLALYPEAIAERTPIVSEPKALPKALPMESNAPAATFDTFDTIEDTASDAIPTELPKAPATVPTVDPAIFDA